MSAQAHSQMVNNGDRIEFTVDPAVTGVTASGTSLIFEPGPHLVKINLPSEFTGDASIQWVDSSGQNSVPQPSVITGVQTGETWVELGLQNDPSSEIRTFFFELSALRATQDGTYFYPVVRSEPPPSLVLESS
ncbi:MAG: hypothetical protein ABUT39_01250 [Acidobacteriota bacterium]